MVHRHGLAENGGSICTIEKASNSQKETNGCLQHTMMAISKLWWVQTNLLISSKELSICIGQIDIIPHYIKSIIQNIMIAEKTHFGGNASAERGERKSIIVIVRSFSTRGTISAHLRYIKLIERSLLRSCHASANSWTPLSWKHY